MGMTDQDGILHTNKDSYKRYNITSFVSADLAKWLTISLDAAYADENKKDPYSLTFNGSGIWGTVAKSPSYFPTGGMMLNDEYLLFTSPRNVLDAVIPSATKRKNTRLMGRATVKPFKGMTVVGEYGFSRTDSNNKVYNQKETQFILGEEYAKTQSVNKSKFTRNTFDQRQHTLNIFGTYNITLNTDHNLTAMVGFNQEKFIRQDLNAWREEMIIPGLPGISLGSGEVNASDSQREYTVRGVFGRLNYDYKGKYLFEVNGRYDGSSRFPKNKKYGFFPSTSVAWRLSEEAFMSDTKHVVSNIKLRGSFGSIGNQNIGEYEQYATMGVDARNEWMLNGQPVVTLNTPGLVRSDFSWEKAETTNVGIDLGFINKINLTYDYYIRRTKGMLGPMASLPNLLGTSAPKVNAADLKTSGWELEISYNDQFGAVGVRGAFNISDDKSKITKYKNDTKTMGDGTYYEGQVIDEIWGYVTDRYYTVDDFEPGTLTTTSKGELTGGKLKPGIAHIENVEPNPGDVLYKDLDGNGIINTATNTRDNPGDRKIIGNSNPRFRYGFSLGANWKNFDLSVLFQGVGKRDYWLANNQIFPFTGEWNTVYDHQLNYWTPNNTDSEFPRIYERSGVNSGNNRRVQTGYLSDLSYIRLKNITLTYNIPTNFVRKIHFQSAKVFFSGEDLFTWHKLPKGSDPEMSTDNRGGHGAIYPPMHRFSFGVNVTF